MIAPAAAGGRFFLSIIPDGREPDTVMEVVAEDGDLIEGTVDEEETEARRERAQDRFDRLSRRLSDEQDEDDDR